MNYPESPRFLNSRIGKRVLTLLPPKAQWPDANNPEQQKLDASFAAIMPSVLEARALIARLNLLSDSTQDPTTLVQEAVTGIVDSDIVDDMRTETDPAYAATMEYAETAKTLRELFAIKGVLRAYIDLYERMYTQISQAKKIQDMYRNDHTLTQTEKIGLVRQLSRILNSLIMWCEEEEQNIHNQVVRERRGYRKSDYAILAKLKNNRMRCATELNQITANDIEAKIQLRRDEIKIDKGLLVRRVPKDVAERNNGLTGQRYIVTPSRKKILFGDETTPENSIMSALRKRHNVELFGPTGTGKTKLAEHAAALFSGKPAVVLSGNPSLSRYDILGKTVGLDKRDDGALITCLKEGRVLIVDEDNRIDPRNLAVIKYALGLRVGDLYIHPETGERIPVPAGFGVICTRNEKGKHHQDRFDLPPDYRREFTNGSFDVGYFTKDEMYDHFLIPKLTEDDGSMELSLEEVGGVHNDPKKRSPLLALVLASEEIQLLYRQNKIADGVFESGFMIELFDDWHEQRASTNCSFLSYVETRLINFIRRPIGNPARKLIIQKLVEQGFFTSKGAKDFETQDEGLPVEQEELDSFRGAPAGSTATARRTPRTATTASTAPAASPAVPTQIIFPAPSGMPLDARAVALLDPFEKRKMNVAPHPLEGEISQFKTAYLDFCSEKGIQPVMFSSHNFTARRAAIIQSVTDYIDRAHIGNAETFKAIFGATATNTDALFISEFVSGLAMLLD